MPPPPRGIFKLILGSWLFLVGLVIVFLACEVFERYRFNRVHRANPYVVKGRNMLDAYRKEMGLVKGVWQVDALSYFPNASVGVEGDP